MSTTKPSYPWAEGDALFASELNAAIANAGGGPFLPITIGDGTGSPTLTLNGAVGTAKGVRIQTAGTDRWLLETDGADNLSLNAYDAAGTWYGTAIQFANNAASIVTNFPLVLNATNATAAAGVTGLNSVSRNTGSNYAQGHKFTYFSSANGGDVFDIGWTNLAIFDPATWGAPGTSYDATWIVAVSPNDSAHSWAANGMEIDISNRGPDMGWKRDRGSLRPTGGILIAAETNIFAGTGGGEGKNATFGLCVAHSGATNSTGFFAKFYNGLLIEPDSVVGLTGRGIYMSGDVTATPSQYPYGPFQTEGTWLHGIDHTLATYVDNHAAVMKTGQGLAWITGTTGTPGGTATITGSGSGADASITLAAAGAGKVAVTGKMSLASIPTSAAGLVAGDVWRNGTVLNII